jgi:hypothetical protein
MQFQPAMLQEGIGININGAAQPDCHRVGVYRAWWVVSVTSCSCVSNPN